MMVGTITIPVRHGEPLVQALGELRQARGAVVEDEEVIDSEGLNPEQGQEGQELIQEGEEDPARPLIEEMSIEEQERLECAWRQFVKDGQECEVRTLTVAAPVLDRKTRGAGEVVREAEICGDTNLAATLRSSTRTGVQAGTGLGQRKRIVPDFLGRGRAHGQRQNGEGSGHHQVPSPRADGGSRGGGELLATGHAARGGGAAEGTVEEPGHSGREAVAIPVQGQGPEKDLVQARQGLEQPHGDGTSLGASCGHVHLVAWILPSDRTRKLDQVHGGGITGVLGRRSAAGASSGRGRTSTQPT